MNKETWKIAIIILFDMMGDIKLMMYVNSIMNF
jgi:hypothetical protein